LPTFTSSRNNADAWIWLVCVDQILIETDIAFVGDDDNFTNFRQTKSADRMNEDREVGNCFDEFIAAITLPDTSGDEDGGIFCII